jgi:hypothetical protein
MCHKNICNIITTKTILASDLSKEWEPQSE